MKKLWMILLFGAVIAACSDDDDNTDKVDATFSIKNFPEAVAVEAGKTVSYDITRTGTPELETVTPQGWECKVNGTKLEITAPAYGGNTRMAASDQPSTAYSGTISIKALDGKEVIAEYSTQAQAYKTLTFEDVPATHLAGPSYYGENMYSLSEYNQYEGPQYTGYHDTATGLKWHVNKSGGKTEFQYGGVGVSRWNDMTDANYTNQCSVFFRETATGNGGYAASKTFGVVFSANPDFGGGYGGIYFAEPSVEHVIDHMYVCNTTYAALVMRDGNEYSQALSYENEGWFKLTVAGYDKDGAKKGEAEFYLADFRTANAGGVLDIWDKMDLSSLGKVNKLEFLFSGSDTGDYGLNTPAYVCIDNVMVYL